MRHADVSIVGNHRHVTRRAIGKHLCHKDMNVFHTNLAIGTNFQGMHANVKSTPSVIYAAPHGRNLLLVQLRVANSKLYHALPPHLLAAAPHRSSPAVNPNPGDYRTRVQYCSATSTRTSTSMVPGCSEAAQPATQDQAGGAPSRGHCTVPLVGYLVLIVTLGKSETYKETKKLVLVPLPLAWQQKCRTSLHYEYSTVRGNLRVRIKWIKDQSSYESCTRVGLICNYCTLLYMYIYILKPLSSTRKYGTPHPMLPFPLMLPTASSPSHCKLYIYF